MTPAREEVSLVFYKAYGGDLRFTRPHPYTAGNASPWKTTQPT